MATQAHQKTPSQSARRPQNFFQIGDVAIAEGMPVERRGAFAAHEPDDGGVLNEIFAEVHSGKFAERCADADLPWLPTPKALIPSKDSQREYIELANTGLRWLMANGRDFTTLAQEDVARMGLEMVRENRDPNRVAKIQRWCLSAAQWCVWTKRREALRVDFRPYRMKRDDYIQDGHKPNVVVGFKPGRVRYVDEATEARIVRLIPDIAKRLGVKLAFLGCRGAEAAGVENADVAIDGGESTVSVFGKGAKWRKVSLGADIAGEIDFYRQTVRPLRLAKFRDKNPSEPEPTALLLNAKNGGVLTYTMLRRAFKKAAALLGLDDLKLHWARHAFACNFLSANAILMIRRAAAAGMQLTEGAVAGILEQLRPELIELMGHSSYSTTKQYLTRVRLAILAHLAAYPEPPASTRVA